MMTVKQSGPITWLHISDLHLRNSRAYDANVVLKALLRDVGERIAQDGLRPDFVAVTGDLVFSGKPAEYELVRGFFDELLRVTGLDKGRLFLVPGNHDVDRGLITRGAQAIGDGLTDRDSANDVLATPADRQLMMARFQGYRAFVNDYMAGHLLFDDERYFYVRSLDLAGLRIAIMGLNSAWVSASVEDRAKGLLIGERQARAALDAADEAGAVVKIALLHHPLDWLREFDQNDSGAMLADGCHFILHGHLHHTAATQLTTPDGAATILTGGACYETRQYANTYNWVQLNLADGNGMVTLRRYSDARGGFWAKDTLTYRNVPDGAYRFRLPASLQGRAPSPQQDAPPQQVSQRSSADSGPATGGSIRIDPDNPPVAAIRGLLEAAFTAEELRRFCRDRPAFRPVVASFGPGQGLDDMVDRVIEYCQKRLEWDALLAGVAEVNRAQYDRFEPRLRSGAIAPTAPRLDPVLPAPGPALTIDRAALRRRLDQTFDDPGLDAFCLDYFPEIYDRFSRGMRKDEKMTLLLDHFRRAKDYGPLLAALEAVS